MAGIPRTNNYCESWHNSFSSLLNSHPLIYELIDTIRTEQNKTETMLLKLNTFVVRKSVKNVDETIIQILKCYNPDNKIETINKFLLFL